MKTIKDAVEHFGRVWPYAHEGHRGICFTHTHGWTSCALDSSYLVCTKQQFEDWVKQEEKPMKYKSVPVENMTIWQLGQAVSEGGEFYDVDGDKLSIINGSIESENNGQLALSHQLACNLITTRQPLPWYEQEGVFPCLVKWLGCVFFVSGVKGENLTISGDSPKVVPVIAATPLTPIEAAEYGVE